MTKRQFAKRTPGPKRLPINHESVQVHPPFSLLSLSPTRSSEPPFGMRTRSRVNRALREPNEDEEFADIEAAREPFLTVTLAFPANIRPAARTSDRQIYPSIPG
jgi:hypothetical protein